MVLLNTQLHFIIKILVMAGMRIPAFLLLKIILLVKFLYYIPNANKKEKNWMIQISCILSMSENHYLYMCNILPIAILYIYLIFCTHYTIKTTEEFLWLTMIIFGKQWKKEASQNMPWYTTTAWAAILPPYVARGAYYNFHH